MSYDSVAFIGVSGTNVYQPFGSPTANAQGVYNTDPYSTSEGGSFPSHITADVIKQMKSVGIDHVRLQINPGPFLQARASNSAAKLAALYAQLDVAIDTLIAAGLGVIPSPIMQGYQPIDAVLTILQGITTPAYLAYKAWTIEYITRYSTRDPKYLAFEGLNEPPNQATFPANWLTEIQPDLMAAILQAAPKHTQIRTGTDYSSIFRFAEIVPDLNNNILDTVHPFIPTIFCLQGYIFGGDYKYVSKLEYPPNPTDKTAAIARMTAATNADTTTTPATKTATINRMTQELGYYFDIPQNRAWILAQYSRILNWCKVNKIPPSRIYVGEWGCNRSNAIFKSADRMSRCRYYREHSSVIAEVRMRSAFDHMDTKDYGVTLEQGAKIGAFDPILIASIGPDRLRFTKRTTL